MSRVKAGTNKGAKKWHGMNWITKHKRLAIYLRDGFTCQCCGSDLKTVEPGNIALDHLKPRDDGGTNSEQNLVTVCRTCNSSRGCKKWTLHYPAGAHGRVRSQVKRKLNIELAKAIIQGTAADPRSESER